MNNPTTHFLEANRSSIQIIRLDDSTDFFRALSTDTTDITGTTEHQVTWNTEHEKDSSYTHSANSSVITLAAGFYLVQYNLWCDSGATSTRKTVTSKATLGGSDIPQSYSYSYIRGLNGCNDGVASSLFLLEVTSSSDLEIEAYTPLDENQIAAVNLVSNGGAISIMRLDDNAQKFIAHSNNDQACETNAVIIHETETQEDSDFSHNNSNGFITINTAPSFSFTCFNPSSFSFISVELKTTSELFSRYDVKIFEKELLSSSIYPIFGASSNSSWIPPIEVPIEPNRRAITKIGIIVAGVSNSLISFFTIFPKELILPPL